MERCPPLECPPDQTARRMPGQCCSKCVDLDGICTVFGDPHYKTFDGKFYNFQGSCKYQLTSDCANNTFSIRISNDARNTSHSSWTRTATLRIGPVKINLGRRMRVKVNSKRISLPYKIEGISQITKSNGSVLVQANIGVKLLWDGDGFLEVTVSSVYKGKLCGLCGNFNSKARDDMRARNGTILNNVWEFGSSWKVGGRKACTRQQERPMQKRCPNAKKLRAKRLCRGFGRIEAFSACSGKVNPYNYRTACVRDTCGCASKDCHCAAYHAYARECSRMGAEPRGWTAEAYCAGQPPPTWLGRTGKHSKPARHRFLDPGVVRKQITNSRSRPPPPILH